MAAVGGQRGRRGAAAGDVADHHHPAALHRERVVEVAADPVLPPRRPVERGERVAGDLRQRGRQQRALQRAGDRRALLVQPGVLDRDAGAAPDLLEQLEVGLGEHAPRLGVDERDHAHRRARWRRPSAPSPPSACPGRGSARAARGPRPACSSISSGISGISWACPSRSTCAEPPSSLDVVRIAAPEVARELDLRRVAVDDRDLPDDALAVGHADAAPVRELGHGEAGDLAGASARSRSRTPAPRRCARAPAAPAPSACAR